MRNVASIFGVTLVIAVLSVGFALLPNPEEQALVSSDGAVSLSGFARQSQPLSLHVLTDTFASPLLGRGYDILPSHLAFDRPFSLTFAVSNLGIAVDDVVVLFYREDIGFWTPVADEVVVDGASLVVTTGTTGRYALAVKQVVEAPVFLTAYDELRALAPIEALGYTIDVGYRVDGGPVVALPALAEAGGCSGVFAPTSGTSASEITRDANVLINDVQTAVTFLFHATWNLAPGEQCAPDSALEPLIGS